jgi:transcriptional regulator with XRE-family HTH domain
VLVDLGRRIQEARSEAGLTQEDAASLAGIDWRRWQRLEGGSVNPTVRTLARVARVLGLSFWELVVRPRPRSA